MANPFTKVLAQNPQLVRGLGNFLPGQSAPFGIETGRTPRPYEKPLPAQSKRKSKKPGKRK